MRKTIFLSSLFVVLFCSSCNAQFTFKDLKLCLENVGCSDSTIRITKANLLKGGKLIPNFSWFTIKGLIIYIGEGNFASEMITITANVENLNTQIKTFSEKLSPGSSLTIEVEGCNRSGKRVNWPGLRIKIIE